MTYEEIINFLYNSLPLYHKIGSAAYKPGLQNIEALDNMCGNPHKMYLTIHVAGSNGKGSVSHTLASILQSAGYKTGLYTSPHLIDFRERIRVNGEMIPKEIVTSFTAKYMDEAKKIAPSFFEWTTEMAFEYFALSGVDIAVIETGLGGRLDSTNIISPILSIITNISLEHTELLGNTLPLIAYEKAGIIKRAVPVVIGETEEETKDVFKIRAAELESPIFFADTENIIKSHTRLKNGHWLLSCKGYKNLEYELGGLYQLKNAVTILKAVEVLKSCGINMSEFSVRSGFMSVTKISGLHGRWGQIRENPRVISDTGHNVGGIRYVAEQLKNEEYCKLRIVFGMVNDKDTDGVLALLPKDAEYYFTQASVQRALPATEIQRLGEKHGLKGSCFSSVKEAYNTALQQSSPDELIYVGGSTFVVADLLSAD
ncbi:MAG: folylpolyglutamate synthase/dihydrofolate synthase family protein [Bacteroidales bacterium]